MVRKGLTELRSEGHQGFSCKDVGMGSSCRLKDRDKVPKCKHGRPVPWGSRTDKAESGVDMVGKEARSDVEGFVDHGRSLWNLGRFG